MLEFKKGRDGGLRGGVQSAQGLAILRRCMFTCKENTCRTEEKGYAEVRMPFRF